LYVNLALLAADLIVIAAFTTSQMTLIVAVIISGAFVGLNNTLTTQAVMLVAPVERAVASASYGFVRFIGGGLAPYVASRLAADFNVHVPFYLGAGTVVAAIAVLATGHALLTGAEQAGVEEEFSVPVPTSADAPALANQLNPDPACSRPPEHLRHDHPIVAAVDASSRRGVTDAAIRLAQLLGCRLEILHVIETDVIEELAVDVETLDEARAAIADNVNRLRAAGVAGDGHLVRAVGGHGETGRRIAQFANELGARMIVVGAPEDGEAASVFSAGLTDHLIRYAPCPVHIVPLGSDQPSTAAGQTLR
jgi:nucleotide-binding universal stress UspA family protein